MAKPFQHASAHDLLFEGPVNNLHEGPSIGNGDLGAIVQIFQDEFRLHLSKNDAWDARHDYDQPRAILTQENLVRAGRDFGFRLEGQNYANHAVYDKPPPPECRFPDADQGFARSVHPCPKPVGLIRVLHSGHSTTKIRTRLSLAEGLVRCEFDLEYGWHATGGLVVEAFIEKTSNRARLRVTRVGNLGPIVLAVQKDPDALDDTVPLPAVQAMGDRRGAVTQAIPAGCDVPGFRWHLAANLPEPRPGVSVRPVEAQRFRLWQRVTLEEGKSAEAVVAVATDRDGEGDSLSRAGDLAWGESVDGFDAALARQREDWGRFWDASAVELEDKPLEAAWHRSLFALNGHIAAGAQAPGLCANVVPFDRSPWHGLYTVNMNIQKMFLSALPTNHREWIDCYADWLDQMTPGFARLARETFGIDEVYSPHMVLPYVPPHRQFTTNTCGRSIGMTGWHAQPLWWHYQFTRDVTFLRERTYPYLSSAARFYARYVDQFMDASGDLYPTMNLEMPAWTKDFKHNRDCIIDVILVRATLEQAIAAAKTLGVDEAWREKWAAALKRVRPVRFERLPGGEPFVYIDKNAQTPDSPDWWKRRENRWMCVFAAWSVFPGEYLEGDEPAGDASIARELMEFMKWDTLHPEVTWIHHWWCAIPALRMGLPGAFARARKTILDERFAAGHARTTHWINLQPDAWRCPEDNYLAVAATTEMLLQSQGGVLRLFPGWPRHLSARFRGLPARGGFVVDAEATGGKGLVGATIHSLAGGACRVRWDGSTPPTVACGGERIAAERAGRDVVFPTRAGGEYRLTPLPA